MEYSPNNDSLNRVGSVNPATTPPRPPAASSNHRRNVSIGDVGGPRTEANPGRIGLPKRLESVSKLIDQYVDEMGGDRVIHSVLVANNGLAAVKFMRSIRSWAAQALGSSKAISLVAMATPDDMKINAEHLQLSDQFVEVPGGSNNNNYANVSLIVQVAERAGVDAVWPGWGHASENPELPAALEERGIRFLGPGEIAMAALGDKIGSTILAQAAGVPTLTWSGSGVAISFADCNGVIPEEIYQKACIHSIDGAIESCQRIGYPVMLKASWGGGGKGIRKVHSDDEVRQVFKQVQGEVPGSPIFAMKLAPVSRHLEVQLLCDAHGNVASLLSRDCSIQRRHQKIVEEGPVTAASQEELHQMEKCARALARSVGYVGAATVEYLYLIEEKRYCFLELNPRLQVEHPVTEGITGVNLPSCQLLVGMGIPLWKIPSIRSLYGQDPKGIDRFDLETTPQKPADCHVVAVRITAEDAGDGFKPTCGRIEEIHFRPTPEVWGYFSVKSGGGIHEFSDSQFGHLFSRGETREAAINSMVVALRDVAVRGEIRTTVDYVMDMIQSPELTGNRIHTGWLDTRIALKVQAGRPPWHLSVIAGAVVRAYEHISAQSAEYLAYLSKGQLPPAGITLTHFSEDLVISGSKHRVVVSRSSPTAFTVKLNGSSVDVRTRKMADGGFLLQVDGESHVVHVEEEQQGTRLMINALTVLLSKEVDPSKLIAKSPGKLVRYLVPSGSRVESGMPYAEVEVMKMVMPLLAPASGQVTFLLPEGASIAGGDLIARLLLDDPNAVIKAVTFSQPFPDLGAPIIPSTRLDMKFTMALSSAQMIMSGYIQDVDEVASVLVSCLDNPALPLFKWLDVFSVARGRMPADLAAALDQIVESHADDLAALEDLAAQGISSSVIASWKRQGRQNQLFIRPFPSAELQQAMTASIEAAGDGEKSSLQTMLGPLIAIALQHSGGKESFARSVVMDLFEQLLKVEESFLPNSASGETTEQEAVDALRKIHSGDLQAVLDLVISHQGLAIKSQLALRLMAALVVPSPAPYRPLLRRLTQLRGRQAEELVRKSQNLLEQSLLADLRTVVARTLSGLDMFRGEGSETPSGLGLDALLAITSPTSRAAQASETDAVEPSPRGQTATRRSATSTEGLFRGFGGRISPTASMAEAQIESKIELLVGVPAAVEEALASIMVEHHDGHDPELQRRAADAYIRRIYHPYLLRPPLFKRHASSSTSLTAIWLFDDSAAADLVTFDPTSASKTCAGCLADLSDLADLPSSLSLIGSQVSLFLGANGPVLPLSLHIIVLDSALSLIAPTSLELHPQIILDSKRSINHQSDPEGNTLAEQAAAVALSAVVSQLVSLNIFSVSFMFSQTSSCSPLRASFAWNGSLRAYQSDRFACQVESMTSVNLELCKLSSFDVLLHSQSRNRQWHMFTGIERPDARSYPLRRLFVRGSVRQLGHPALLAASYSGHSSAVASAAIQELEECLLTCLEELSRVQAAPYASNDAASSDFLSGRPDWTHVFISVLPPLPTVMTSAPSFSSLITEGVATDATEKVAASLKAASATLVARHMSKFRSATVAQLEIRLRAAHGEPAWRIVLSMPTGHEIHGEEHVDVFREVAGSGDSEASIVYTPGSRCCPLTSLPPPLLIFKHQAPFSTSFSSGGSLHEARPFSHPLDGAAVLAPYCPLESLQQRRLAARKHNVTYAYDFPAVFEDALREAWAARGSRGEPNSVPPAGRLVEVEELVVPNISSGSSSLLYRVSNLRMQRVDRPAGQNDCGMVAWILTMKTPECPQGRRLVAIANDITFQSGAFSPKEDAVFRAATELALEQRIPIVYLAANSGARVGLSTEVREKIKVAWTDDSDPTKGFSYLFLSNQDYEDLWQLASRDGISSTNGSHPLLRAEKKMVGDEVRWVLSDVIGMEDGIGVECLSGSGAIASAYCRAFREGYTITLVSGRTVGIGAYLARLGRRCIQRSDQPIILTGYSALNKLLGRTVYTSQMQLGGPKVMGLNGVSHHIVRDDLDGVRSVIQLLAFAPVDLGSPSVSRCPPPPPLSSPLSCNDPPDRIVSYSPPSGEKLDPRCSIAGDDGEAGSGWRGGLFDNGSWIESHSGWARTVVTGRARLGGIAVGVIAVETQTVTRQQPADPGNPDSSEQIVSQAGQVWYPDSAEKTALAIEEFDLEGLPLFIMANWRGFSGGQRDLFDGVLQAGSQIVENLRTYRRPIFVYIPRNAELRGGAWVVVDSQINSGCIEMYADPTARGGVLEPEGVVEIKFRAPECIRLMHKIDPVLIDLKQSSTPSASVAASIKSREKALLPIYQQVARTFADMHDTPIRMLAKGVIRSIVPWAKSRSFFSTRLKRRLMEETMSSHVQSTDLNISSRDALNLVQGWYQQANASSVSYNSCLSEDDEEERFLIQQAEDLSFLSWAEGHNGRSFVATELKALRARAASRTATQVLATPEGKEGLLKSLAIAAKRDPSWMLQLRMMLNENEE